MDPSKPILDVSTLLINQGHLALGIVFPLLLIAVVSIIALIRAMREDARTYIQLLTTTNTAIQNLTIELKIIKEKLN